ncbi:MAG: hypothetical protein J6S40_03250 [Thermoguttaceae bacterium]|nr:hypothetical protein [Thermoguttaceae bacterium]
MESTSSRSASARLRGSLTLVLITISAGLIFGRILAVDSIPDRAVQEYRLARIPQTLRDKAKELKKEGLSDDAVKARLKQTAARLRADALKARPTLSANDRSRWLTIRALAEPESRVYRYLPLDADGSRKPRYAKGEILRNTPAGSPDSIDTAANRSGTYLKEWVPYAVDKAMETPGWDTIDMVKHGLSDEEFDPADPYSGYLYSSKPTLLPTLMAGVYWVWLHATGLSLREHPFLVARVLLVIYNLIPLTLGWFFMGRLIERFGGDDEKTADWAKFFAVGTLCFGTFLSTFAVTLNNHLPGAAAIMISLYATARILADGDSRTRYFFAAGLFGALAVACELPAVLIALLVCLALLFRFPKKTLLVSVPAGLAVAAAFFGTNILAHGTFRPAYSQKRDHIALAKAEHPTETDRFLVTSFDPNDWYIYRFFPGTAKRDPKNARMSYWSDRQGVDRGEPSRARYAFHALLGHHGLFSLSPILLLSVAGACIWLFRGPGTERRLFAGGVLLTAVFFFLFYVSRNQGDRSYGGMTCGLRWFFPLIPFWILTMLPALDRLGRTRTGRAAALILLFLSAFSVAYPLWNPWSHPWILNLTFGR